MISTTSFQRTPSLWRHNPNQTKKEPTMMTLKSFDQLPVTPEMVLRARARAYCARAFHAWLTKGQSFAAAALRQCHGQAEVEAVKQELGLMGA